ncbi:MAG: hypothetical protein KAS71_18010 [Bacteroidales bacterium]|nr:hypothetical protein [Bacteroidales bacterium]
MSQNTFIDYPTEDEILEWYSLNGSNIVHKVNNHFHTPFSFSSFDDIKQIFELARREEIKVLGINDFYTTAGFEEFNELSIEYKLFPCFNIEFMGLHKDMQKANIRVNDPNNPGRTYLSGKGLNFPAKLEKASEKKLEGLLIESAKQTEGMLNLVAEHIGKIDPDLILDKKMVYKNYTKGMLRERHIARAIREVIQQKYQNEKDQRAILKEIYGKKASKSDLNNNAELEAEIRSMLLKSGGVAYVKESPKAFLEVAEVLKIITDAGGIPTYPVLLDDINGNYTEFERDMEKLYNDLSSMNIYSLELIPGRNNIERLEEFVSFFHDRNFIISFGTEHNTPEMIPLKISAREGVPLSEYLNRVSFEGVCVIAAHQYSKARGKDGYIDKNGKVRLQHKDEFIELGNAVIEYFLQN